MGIFGSISAINRANKQLKKIEYELDELIGEIQSGIYYSASSLRMRHQQIQRDIEVFPISSLKLQLQCRHHISSRDKNFTQWHLQSF